MGMRMPETCWTVFKQVINLKNWLHKIVWFISMYHSLILRDKPAVAREVQGANWKTGLTFSLGDDIKMYPAVYYHNLHLQYKFAEIPVTKRQLSSHVFVRHGAILHYGRKLCH
jgi:hypothetical protein